MNNKKKSLIAGSITFVAMSILLTAGFIALFNMPKETPPEKPPEVIYYLGDTQTMNDWEITILAVENGKRLASGKTTQNNYLRVALSIKNLLNSDRQFSLSDIKVFDSNNNGYTVIDNMTYSFIAGEMKSNCYYIFETLQPSDVLEHRIVVYGGELTKKTGVTWRLVEKPMQND